MKHWSTVPVLAFAAVLLASVSLDSFADEHRDARDGLRTLAFLTHSKSASARSGVTLVRDRHWHFVGCANSHRHCHHLADHAGYHHATVRYDEHSCHHHPHLACYAWN